MVPSGLRISQITPAGWSPARRARSSEASVWPARLRTPPGRASSGKRCPGLTRSRSVEAGSSSVRTVCARSSALMDLLGEVDSAIDAEHGIMIASLVVRADTGMPGDGYFVFAAEELGRAALDDPRAFWLAEVERVWDAFSDGETEAAAWQGTLW